MKIDQFIKENFDRLNTESRLYVIKNLLALNSLKSGNTDKLNNIVEEFETEGIIEDVYNANISIDLCMDEINSISRWAENVWASSKVYANSFLSLLNTSFVDKYKLVFVCDGGNKVAETGKIELEKVKENVAKYTDCGVRHISINSKNYKEFYDDVTKEYLYVLPKTFIFYRAFEESTTAIIPDSYFDNQIKKNPTLDTNIINIIKRNNADDNIVRMLINQMYKVKNTILHTYNKKFTFVIPHPHTFYYVMSNQYGMDEMEFSRFLLTLAQMFECDILLITKYDSFLGLESKSYIAKGLNMQFFKVQKVDNE